MTLPPPTPIPEDGWAAIVLAGGTSARWGGRDKTAASLSGRFVLRHAVDAVLPDACRLVVVAPAAHPAREAVASSAAEAGCPLSWTREDPPGGGPVAGLAAGLAALGEQAPPRVVLLAGDLPFARTALPRLLAALAFADAALGLDPDGHRQPLLAAYRTVALTDRLSGPVRDLPMRAVLTGLRVIEVPVTEQEALDLDTPEALTRAQSLIDAVTDAP